VGVDTAGESAVVVVMLVIAVLLPFVRIGRHTAVGQADKPVMGAFAQAPMRSRHPTARVRNDTTHRVDGSRQGQQIHVRHTEGQTQRAVPGTSSLAYVETFRPGFAGDRPALGTKRGGSAVGTVDRQQSHMSSTA
jgi:hypothetical protein